LSQSDLLFILSAGGVYQGSLGSARSFESDLFPVYASVNNFLTLYPLLLNMSYSVPENVSTAKWAAYNKKFFTKKPREEYRQQKLQVFHRLPEVRSSSTTEQD